MAGDYTLSVAGLQQLGDETIALAIATELGLMEKKEAGKIINISNNKLFLPLIKAIALSKE